MLADFEWGAREVPLLPAAVGLADTAGYHKNSTPVTTKPATGQDTFLTFISYCRLSTLKLSKSLPRQNYFTPRINFLSTPIELDW